MTRVPARCCAFVASTLASLALAGCAGKLERAEFVERREGATNSPDEPTTKSPDEPTMWTLWRAEGGDTPLLLTGNGHVGWTNRTLTVNLGTADRPVIATLHLGDEKLVLEVPTSKERVPALVHGRLELVDAATFVRRDMDYKRQEQQTSAGAPLLDLTQLMAATRYWER